ncbi:MAG: dNTP triphosphohydrolase [Phycisphaerae bacterium]|nr:dNTP triphosphohydrolase [Phycisphaerae bacterium]
MGASRGCPREDFEGREDAVLSPHATRFTDERAAHRSYPQPKDEFRTDFQRDYTRIIHSRAFRRLRHKTQVFIDPRNDHICTRMEHSLHVASVASTIAQALKLNVDLVRAIAVGHDLGHAPFGHKGERSLNAIAEKHDLSFSHELHSLRVVDYLESPYPDHHGLNLTFAVRDGIACHYGEGFEQELRPERQKPYDALLTMTRGKARPATLEGCVVRWADKIAYLGRDLEDALSLDIVREDDVPQEARDILGTSNRDIIHSLVSDLVKQGIDGDSLSVSKPVHDALNIFYSFSREKIYKTFEVTRSFEQIDRAMRVVFEFLLDCLAKAQGDLSSLKKREQREPCLKVFVSFLEEDVREWDKQRREQLVIDFIAGMTDSFFTRAFVELFLPSETV